MGANKARLNTLLFPLAALYNSFSMTALLLLYGLAGRSVIAADIALVQAASLALFYAFSANARNLILSAGVGGTRPVVARLLQVRLLLALPLAALVAILSIATGDVPVGLVVVLIVRRISEWVGEIALAEHEVNAHTRIAKVMVSIETAGLLLAASPLFFDFDFAGCAVPWALTPLVAISGTRLSLKGAGMSIRTLLPHVGSTAMIGAGVYIFRLSIVLLAGKMKAGALFTAFAIGGLIPTVLGQALVPTLIHRCGAGGALKRLFLPLLGVLGAGLVVSLFALSGDMTSLFGHPLSFWRAVGLSLIGGGIMTVAAVLRASLIQSGKGDEVFGADMVANILIATCVPFVFYVLSPGVLSGLYLLSAVLSLTSFMGANHLAIPRRLKTAGLHVLAASLIFPIFVQLSGGLFDDPAYLFDPQRSIMLLPLPLSIIAMFAGIAVLGKYASALRALAVLFFSALLFVATSLIGAGGGVEQIEAKAKLILLAQFLMPMFALVLGQMYAATDDEMIFERSAAWMLLLILPAQLLASWLQGSVLPYPKVFFFSIYQHLQYFPIIVAALFMIAVPPLVRHGHKGMIAASSLAAVAGVYLLATQSVEALIGLAAAIVLVFLGCRRLSWRKGNRGRAPLQQAAVCALIVGAFTVGGSLILGSSTNVAVSAWQSELSAEGVGQDIEASASLVGRSAHWAFYAPAIGDSLEHFLIGHAAPPPHEEHPSAYNYWLDIAYNFGAISLLPLLALLAWTARVLWRARDVVLASPLLAGNACAVLYLVFFESMLKVGMRQPYPGIVTYFLWGLLITRLSKVAQESGPVRQ